MPPGWYKHPPLPAAHIHQLAHASVPVRTVVIGGMPGWQIALIALGDAMFAAAVAVLADRTWAGPRTAKRSQWPGDTPALILLTDLLTTAMDKSGCCWTDGQAAPRASGPD